MKYLIILALFFASCKKENPIKEYSVQLSVDGDAGYVQWFKNREKIGFIEHKFYSGDTSTVNLYRQPNSKTPVAKLYVDDKVVWEGNTSSRNPNIYIFK